MELNKKDGGNRSFILVQLPETLSRESKDPITINDIQLLDSYKLPLNLAYITVDRLRRIMIGCGYNGRTDFDWIKKNKKFDESLEVLDLVEYSIYDANIFEKIDERLYGIKKLDTIQQKTDWVCQKFEKVARKLIDASRN